MNIVFLYRGFESLAIQYLSAKLKLSGHRTSLVYDPALFNTTITPHDFFKLFFDCTQKLAQETARRNPDLVCFSVSSDDYAWASRVAAQIKKQIKVSIVFGGTHPSLVPDEVIKEPFIDYVCVGEGEDALQELVERLKENRDCSQIANIWGKKDNQIISNSVRPLIDNLDTLPHPDKTLFYSEYKGFNEDHYAIVTSRGCAFACSFCYNSSYRKLYANKGNFLRRRSVENVIEELKQAKAKYRLKRVCFYDDIFISDKLWLEKFSKQYKRYIKIPNQCFIHSGMVDREIVKYLSDMNCCVVSMGIQTINSNTRKKVLLRDESNEQTIKAIELFKNSPISLYVDIMVGFPGQRAAELIDTARFLNCYKPDQIRLYWLMSYPRMQINSFIYGQDGLNIYKMQYDKKLAKLGSLIMCSNVISKSWLNFIIKFRLFNWFPSLQRSPYASNLWLIFLMALFQKRNPAKRVFVTYSIGYVIKYYFYYFKRFLSGDIAKLKHK